ncbi:acyltransferase family protein [Dysgonomonas sp. Marseille-P4361]|uniref:acyltransferase family protein n=1 Tax=Dysgonomonas sp. Marseille-P4361 TaxID=2161820 RepID=UPI000D552BC7|nr:acyltransferase family protein [Dysgonomonas sp. Marseille-P4361]
MEYRKDIQGLRTIAVLFVFIFHLNSNWLPGGFIGVDIFFVISGYLISSIILSKLDRNKFTFIDFYKSRIKRIIPAYYFLLLIVAVIGLFAIIPPEVGSFRKSLFWSLLFNSNNYFATLDTYFGTANIENPLLHTWTLAVEMQFYLFLPLILFWVKRKWLLPLITVFTIALFAYSSVEIFLNNNQQTMYYSLLSRTPEFFMGVLISLIPAFKTKKPEKYSFPLSLVGLVLLFSSAFILNGESDFPGLYAIVPCLGAGLLIAYPSNYIQKILSQKYIVYIGELSYSMYLWHWPIMAFIRYYYNTISLSFLQYGIVIVLTILLSLFSYYTIETPLRKKKDRKFIIYLGGMAILCCGLILTIPKASKKISPIPLTYIMPSFGLESHGHTFKGVGIYGDSTASNDSILLIGDSHASNFSCYMDYLGKKNHFAFRKISNNSYPLIPEIESEIFGKKEQGGYTNYLKLIEYANKEIANSKIIFLQYFAKHSEKWEDEVCSLIDNLKNDQYLILVSDFPELDKNPVRENRNYIKDKSRENKYKVTWHKPTEKVINYIASSPNAFTWIYHILRSLTMLHFIMIR